jgi:formylglycine-generating enzyme required for sulfatase activity
MAHVFLSHSSADSAGAKAVAHLLRNAGVEVWLDLDQLTPMRGGSWNLNPQYVRVSYRDRYGPTFRSNSVGFRCAGEIR